MARVRAGLGADGGEGKARGRRWSEDLGIGKDEMSAKFVRTPKLADVPYASQMHPHLIVEFYSR